MPQVLKLPHADEQVRLTEEWIRGETVIPEIAHLWPPGPVASVIWKRTRACISPWCRNHPTNSRSPW